MAGMYLPPVGTVDRASQALARMREADRNEVGVQTEVQLSLSEVARWEEEEASRAAVMKSTLAIGTQSITAVKASIGAAERCEVESKSELSIGQRLQKEMLSPKPDSPQAREQRLKDYAEKQAMQGPEQALDGRINTLKKSAQKTQEAKGRHAGLRDQIAEQAQSSAVSARDFAGQVVRNS